VAIVKKNKPNSKPIQSQFKPKQTQNKPNQTQFSSSVNCQLLYCLLSTVLLSQAKGLPQTQSNPISPQNSVTPHGLLFDGLVLVFSAKSPSKTPLNAAFFSTALC
jgi:hypothetical protein